MKLHFFSIIDGNEADPVKNVEVVRDDNQGIDNLFAFVEEKYKKKYKKFSINYYGGVDISKMFVEEKEGEEKKVDDKEEKEEFIPEKEKTYSQFLCSLRYSIDLFSDKITKSDKATIEKIINKLS